MPDTIVVKVGSSSVTTPRGDVDEAVLISVAADVSARRAQGENVVLVSSGAIAAGWSAVGAGERRPKDTTTLQAVAAVGQPLLMDAWRRAFSDSAPVGQVLLSPLDFAHRSQYLKARRTLEALLGLRVVPVVNENDAVADEEIRYGDNDRLAALVANLLGATRLVLLTDAAGLLSADPRLDPSATLIEEVRAFDRDVTAAAGAAGIVGSGGMASKVQAARLATWSGVETAIGSARRDGPVSALLDRLPGAGTWFPARADRLPARKAWIAFARPSSGRLILNEGAARAIVSGGGSLLGVGVIGADGEFGEGDVVEMVDVNDVIIAKGVTRCDAHDVGDHDGVVVHRDDLVVVQSV